MLNPNPELNEKIKLVLDEPFKTFQPRAVVQLPCKHASIEVTNYQDTYLECPLCHKKYLMVNNKHGSKKLYGNK